MPGSKTGRLAVKATFRKTVGLRRAGVHALVSWVAA
jgi:hypothetical protein